MIASHLKPTVAVSDLQGVKESNITNQIFCLFYIYKNRASNNPHSSVTAPGESWSQTVAVLPGLVSRNLYSPPPHPHPHPHPLSSTFCKQMIWFEMLFRGKKNLKSGTGFPEWNMGENKERGEKDQ